MVVGSARDHVDASLAEALGKCRGVFHNASLIVLELLLECFAECDRLRGDHVHERSALRTGEDRLVDRLRILLAAKDHTATGTS